MDTNFDIVTLAHKKALKCAEAHRKIVTDNFDHLYDLLVSSFDDDRFCKRITSLKRGGRATVSIPLKPEDEKICYARRIWFRIQKSKSVRKDEYQLGIGVDLRTDHLNIYGYKKIWGAGLVTGGIDDVFDEARSESFKDSTCEGLSSYIFNVYYDYVYELILR